MSQVEGQELGPKQQQDEEEVMHLVMMPYPLQGHINPMMQFAKSLIANYNVKVSFVNTKHNHAQIKKTHNLLPPSLCAGTMPSPPPVHILHDTLKPSSGHARHKLQQKLEFLWVDNELLADFDYTDIIPRYNDFHFAILSMQGPFRQLLETLKQKNPPVSCVIFGSFCPWVHAICAELGIPSVFFWTQSTAVLNIYQHAPLLAANGFFPYKKHSLSNCNEENVTSHKTSSLVSYIPGVPPLHPSNIPTILHVDSLSDRLFLSIREQLDVLQKCQGVVVNSFEELERDAYQAIRQELPCPVSLVGPLIPSAFLEGDANDTSIGASLFEEKFECIEWLNCQRKQSVLYVSFGSLFHLSTDDLASIGNGIRDSKQPFLWALKNKSCVENVASVLPEGFMDDIKERGLIIPWAPQMQVLSHPSLGAFLTHCGWNSTLESVSMGVPMIPCPLMSDQSTNSIFACEIWKTGMAIQRHDDGLIRSLDVERVVRTVLEEKEGEEIRRRAVKLCEAARRAVREQGSSCNHMEKFIQRIRKLSIQKKLLCTTW
ncbi:hypothetical protein L7F22_039876 [Adiantum nelumboides]|nr:hypothetical protein [Adiantum nelumboides]